MRPPDDGAGPSSEDSFLETMRSLTQVTLRARSRAELERRVCETFVESAGYRLAWIGEVEPGTDRVVPRTVAGADDGYLSEVDVTVGGEATARGPTGRAFDRRTVQVVQDVEREPSYEPWRAAALERGFRSSAAVPLVYDGVLHGVLSIYSTDPESFDAAVRELLGELGEDVAFALEAIETRAELDRSRDLLARTEELTMAGGWEYDPAAEEVRLTDGARRLLGGPETAVTTLESLVGPVASDDRPALERALGAAEASGEPFDLTLPLDGPEGDRRWVRMVGRPTDGAEGHPLVRGAVQDVTDQREHADRLATRNEQLLVLNRIVRHDIRNDMTIVLGWGEELADHVDESGAEMLERILDTSQHVVDLTYDLRDFVRTLETDEPSDPRATRLGEVLAEEVEKRRSAYPEATFVIPDPLAEESVLADELLSSVFRNLLDNAVIHNDADDPRVEVTVERDEGMVAVRVADNGPGIPPGRREAILGRTGQGLDHPDAGLGLYLVDSLVASYDGELRIEPNEPRGTAVVVALRSAEAADNYSSVDADRGHDGQ